MQNNNGVLIEVCCGSVDDAVRACAAGADRVELNMALDAGGLTPSNGMLKQVLERIKTPVICMIRPRAGGFCYSDLEFASMMDDAKMLMDMGAAGLAFGLLRQDGTLDMERCARMIEAAGGGEMVFHRAFDVMHGETERELDDLIALGFRRVLTSGREPSAPQGAAFLRRCVAHAGDRIEILAGGGVRMHNALTLLQDTGVRQLHFTCHTTWTDRSAAGAAMSFDAPGADPFAVKIVEPDSLYEFVRLLRKQEQNGNI